MNQNNLFPDQADAHLFAHLPSDRAKSKPKTAFSLAKNVTEQIRMNVLQNDQGFMHQLKHQTSSDLGFRESSCYEPGMDQPQTSLIYETKPVQELVDQMNNKTFQQSVETKQDYSLKTGKENARFKVKHSFQAPSSGRRQTGNYDPADMTLKIDYTTDLDGSKGKPIHGGGSSESKKEQRKFKIITNGSSKHSSTKQDRIEIASTVPTSIKHQNTTKQKTSSDSDFFEAKIIKSKTATIQYDDVEKDQDNNRSQSKGILGKVMDFTVMKFGNLFRAESPSGNGISLRINNEPLKSERGTTDKRSSVLNPLKPPLYESKQAMKSDPKDLPIEVDGNSIQTMSQKYEAKSSDAKAKYPMRVVQSSSNGSMQIKKHSQSSQKVNKTNQTTLQTNLSTIGQLKNEKLALMQEVMNNVNFDLKPKQIAQSLVSVNVRDVADLSNPQIIKPPQTKSKNPNTIASLLSSEKSKTSMDLLIPPDIDSLFSNHSKQSKSGASMGKNHSSSKVGLGKTLNISNNYLSDATTATPSPNPPIDIGLSPGEALQKYKDILTMFEKTELSQFDSIYGVGSVRRVSLQEVSDSEGYYRAKVGEQLGYRYQVSQIVDKGAFGQVVRCIDLRDSGREVALKISRNKKFDVDNAQVEYKILNSLKAKDPNDQHGIVRVIDSFPFRKHVVLVFELLGSNLYKYMRTEAFKNLNKIFLKHICSQILNSLVFLKKVGVIHCDMKPENILFIEERCENVKIIDFGSSCMSYKTGFSYVQSRYYRAPEIVLGLPYNQAADMWSFGCIVAELTTGRPLFPALDENELLEFFVMMIGLPSVEMVERAKKKARFFDKDFKLIRSKQSRLAMTEKKSYQLRQVLSIEDDPEFADFLEKCLEINPDKRLTAADALKHPWIAREQNLSALSISGSFPSGSLSNALDQVNSLDFSKLIKGAQNMSQQPMEGIGRNKHENVRPSEVADSSTNRQQPKNFRPSPLPHQK